MTDLTDEQQMRLAGRPLRIEYSIILTAERIWLGADHHWRVEFNDGATLDFGEVRPAWDQGNKIQVIYRRAHDEA